MGVTPFKISPEQKAKIAQGGQVTGSYGGDPNYRVASAKEIDQHKFYLTTDAYKKEQKLLSESKNGLEYQIQLKKNEQIRGTPLLVQDKITGEYFSPLKAETGFRATKYYKIGSDGPHREINRTPKAAPVDPRKAQEYYNSFFQTQRNNDLAAAAKKDAQDKKDQLEKDSHNRPPEDDSLGGRHGILKYILG